MKTKRFFTKGMLLIAVLTFILVSCQLDESTSGDKARSITNSTKAILVHNVEAGEVQRIDSVTYEIFGDKKIRSSEYLYNLDDSPDFIYVDFENYGYVVYFKDTMEMMEK